MGLNVDSCMNEHDQRESLRYPPDLQTSDMDDVDLVNETSPFVPGVARSYGYGTVRNDVS